MDRDLVLPPVAQQASRQYVHTEVSSSAQAHLGDHIGDIHHHHHAASAGRAETPPSPSSTVPFRRDTDYIDRGTLLTQLEQKCTEPAARVALVGIGGVGKSQLAIEYCHRLRERCPGTWVFWIYASTADRIVQGFQEIAEEVKIPGHDDPRKDTFELVKKWLRNEKQKWLLVLDNLDDDAVLTLRQDFESKETSQTARRPRTLSEYLPQTGNGRLLITTRTMAVAYQLVEPRDVIQINPMTNTEATALLARKLDGNLDEDDLLELATALEYMPLAIIQAAAYIQRKAPVCSVRQYIDQFNGNDQARKGLLSYEAGHLRRDHEARNSVINSWQISFDHLRQRWPSSANLLSVMSFFDRQGIPEYVLREGSEPQQILDDWCDADNGTTFDDDVERLRDYSLISVEMDGHTFAMHRLVQLATRDWLAQHGQDQKQRAVFLERLLDGFPPGRFENWATCEELLPHVTTMEAVRPNYSLDDESLYLWGSILHYASWYTYEQGRYADAERMCHKAMTAVELAAPHREDEAASIWSMLAQIYKVQGRLKEAEALELKAVDVRKRVLGENHLHTLTSMDALAMIYWDRGRRREAEKLQVQVLETRKKEFGETHRNTLTSMSNLVTIFLDQGRLLDAESLQLRVLEAHKQVLGEEHIWTLNSTNLLACIYRSQGRLEEAEALFTQVMRARKSTLGEEHPKTLASMDGLATVIVEQGRLEEAEALAVKVLEARRRILGDDDPNTLQTIQNLSTILADQGRSDEALVLATQVLEADRRLLGEDNNLTLQAVGNIGTILLDQGKLDEAEAQFVHALDASRRTLGEEHPQTHTGMHRLGVLLGKQGRLEEAIELLTSCERLRSKLLGPEHPNTRSASRWLAGYRARLAQQRGESSYTVPPSPESPSTATPSTRTKTSNKRKRKSVDRHKLSPGRPATRARTRELRSRNLDIGA